VVKLPDKDQYTVQGGTKKAYEPSQNCRDISLRALQAIAGNKKLLYARIDILFPFLFICLLLKQYMYLMIPFYIK
jgi:hypothetical protein